MSLAQLVRDGDIYSDVVILGLHVPLNSLNTALDYQCCGQCNIQADNANRSILTTNKAFVGFNDIGGSGIMRDGPLL